MSTRIESHGAGRGERPRRTAATARAAVAALATVTALATAAALAGPDGAPTVTGRMQRRPGAPMEDSVEAAVHRVPVDLPLAAARDADLPDGDLVLGVVADGAAVAFPIRYLANYEVVDHRVGDLPVAPTW